jgi:hypothetical protein
MSRGLKNPLMDVKVNPRGLGSPSWRPAQPIGLGLQVQQKIVAWETHAPPETVVPSHDSRRHVGEGSFVHLERRTHPLHSSQHEPHGAWRQRRQPARSLQRAHSFSAKRGEHGQPQGHGRARSCHGESRRDFLRYGSAGSHRARKNRRDAGAGGSETSSWPPRTNS